MKAEFTMQTISNLIVIVDEFVWQELVIHTITIYVYINTSPTPQTAVITTAIISARVLNNFYERCTLLSFLLSSQPRFEEGSPCSASAPRHANWYEACQLPVNIGTLLIGSDGNLLHPPHQRTETTLRRTCSAQWTPLIKQSQDDNTINVSPTRHEMILLCPQNSKSEW